MKMIVNIHSLQFLAEKLFIVVQCVILQHLTNIITL
jgi:hypothetical protein